MLTRCNGCRGFTLVEAMVASAILTVGVLTLTGMQMASLSRNVDANELTLATNLAADMIERLRFTGDNNPSTVTALYNGIDTKNAATCNAITQQQVKGDCQQWQTLLTGSGLSAVQGLVQVAPFGPVAPSANQASQIAVQINWTGRNAGGVGRARTLVLTTVVDPR
jgi:type IV pilus assembly protein PilV